MFHAWSTVLKEQVGGLIKVLIYPTSQDEVVELSQTVGGTNLGCQNSPCSAGLNGDEDASEGLACSLCKIIVVWHPWSLISTSYFGF